MAYQRTSIALFSLSNKAYITATVAFYTIDSAGDATDTLATLYDAATGTGTLANPHTMDSEGKFAAPAYVEVPVIGSVSNSDVENHSTGIIYPRLSDADITTAEDAASAAATSSLAATGAASDAADSAALAATAQAAAEAAVGTVKLRSTDTTAGVLLDKLTFTSPMGSTVSGSGGDESAAIAWDQSLLSDTATIAAADEFMYRRNSDGAVVVISRTDLLTVLTPQILSPYNDVEEVLAVAQAMVDA